MSTESESERRYNSLESCDLSGGCQSSVDEEIVDKIDRWLVHKTGKNAAQWYEHVMETNSPPPDGVWVLLVANGYLPAAVTHADPLSMAVVYNDTFDGNQWYPVTKNIYNQNTGRLELTKLLMPFYGWHPEIMELAKEAGVVHQSVWSDEEPTLDNSEIVLWALPCNQWRIDMLMAGFGFDGLERDNDIVFQKLKSETIDAWRETQVVLK